jgi:hypothetical protein
VALAEVLASAPRPDQRAPQRQARALIVFLVSGPAMVFAATMVKTKLPLVILLPQMPLVPLMPRVEVLLVYLLVLLVLKLVWLARPSMRRALDVGSGGSQCESAQRCTRHWLPTTLET